MLRMLTSYRTQDGNCFWRVRWRPPPVGLSAVIHVYTLPLACVPDPELSSLRSVVHEDITVLRFVIILKILRDCEFDVGLGSIPECLDGAAAERM